MRTEAIKDLTRDLCELHTQLRAGVSNITLNSIEVEDWEGVEYYLDTFVERLDAFVTTLDDNDEAYDGGDDSIEEESDYYYNSFSKEDRDD